MKIRSAVAVVAALAVAGFFVGRPHRDATYVSHFENVMGTSLELKVLARTDAAAAAAEAAVLAEIDRESKILSAYDPASEFSRWMRTSQTAAPVSPELFEILDEFDRWRARTGGALDPSAEAITRVWKAAAAESRMPTRQELNDAVDTVRQPHWRLERASLTATHTSAAPMALNSFTKSYIVDRAARRGLAVSGVIGLLVNVGGDMVVRGDWTQTVGVANPTASADNGRPLGSLVIRDRAVASSGGYKRGVDIAGQHFSHIVDPRTGQPTGHVLGATVVAPNAVDAGALATAFCVLTPEDSQALAKTVPDAEFVIVLASGQRIESAGWHSLAETPEPRSLVTPPVTALYAADQSPWSSGWELTLTFELARLGGMAKRPYLAAWIEDADHFPVRTISVWYDNKLRYLPELRAWYRADRLRSMAEGTPLINAVTSATRSAGKYTLQWDGKDNAGKFVKNGSYTVFLEVAREHGSYQLLKQDMELAGAPKSVTLPGGPEVASATFDYHKANGR
jgi:thiamine biosynthesis lipoprotein